MGDPVKLTPAMSRHLRELAEIADTNPHHVAFWHPESPGEWRCAEALGRRGLLSRQIMRGRTPFALSRAGYEAGRRALEGERP